MPMIRIGGAAVRGAVWSGGARRLPGPFRGSHGKDVEYEEVQPFLVAAWRDSVVGGDRLQELSGQQLWRPRWHDHLWANWLGQRRYVFPKSPTGLRQHGRRAERAERRGSVLVRAECGVSDAESVVGHVGDVAGHVRHLRHGRCALSPVFVSPGRGAERLNRSAPPRGNTTATEYPLGTMKISPSVAFQSVLSGVALLDGKPPRRCGRANIAAPRSHVQAYLSRADFCLPDLDKRRVSGKELSYFRAED